MAKTLPATTTRPKMTPILKHFDFLTDGLTHLPSESNCTKIVINSARANPARLIKKKMIYR